MTPEEIKKQFPNVTIKVWADGFSVSGTIKDGDAVDVFMHAYVPTQYRRGMMWVGYESNESYRTYRRQDV